MCLSVAEAIRNGDGCVAFIVRDESQIRWTHALMVDVLRAEGFNLLWYDWDRITVGMEPPRLSAMIRFVVAGDPRWEVGVWPDDWRRFDDTKEHRPECQWQRRTESGRIRGPRKAGTMGRSEKGRAAS
jgi:hypothetical protein